MLKTAIKKTAITEVLSCFLVFAILMSAVPVSVLASDSSDDVTGDESRDKNIRALGKGIKSPNPVCNLIGPKEDTTLSKDVGYTFIFRLINEEGWLAEKGENARVTVKVTGGKIKSAKLPSSRETCFMKVIRPSDYTKFYDYGGKEFKEGGIKGGSFVVVPTGNKLTVKITAKIDDVDGGDPSTAEKSLTYYKIAKLSADISKALESLSNLASSRANVTGTYIDMYRNFIESGELFKGMSVDDYTYNYVDQARFAGEFSGVAEVGLNWMVDPTAGMVSGFTGIINKIFGIPSVLDLILAMGGVIEDFERGAKIHECGQFYGPCADSSSACSCEELSNIDCDKLHLRYNEVFKKNTPLASINGNSGALNYLREKQTKESNAWENGQLDEVITILKNEGELVDLSKCIACCCFHKGEDNNVEVFFQLVLDHLEQESETISKLIKIAEDLRPKPEVTKTAPSEIALGEKAVIEIKGVTKGGPCYGYLGLAFPDLNAEALEQNPSPVRIVKESTTAPHPKIFNPGNLVIQDYGKKFIPELKYKLVSFESAGINGYNKPEYWPPNTEYTLQVEVEPEKAGDFHYEYKMVTFIAGPSSYRADPAIDSDEPNDQQNEKVYKGIIKVTAPPDPPPTITITEPKDGQTFTTDTITVSGTASDNDAVSKVEVKVGSGSWQEAQEKESWSMSVTLAPGENTIYAKATDTSGKSREASVTVTYTTADRPPTITITEPTNGQTFTTDTITVSGTASDNDAVSKVEVKVGSGSWQEAQEKESWSMSITLALGENTIYAKATDTSGQSREASVTVTYTTADRPPTITITEPTNGQTFTTDTITVSGTASDNDDVSKVEVQVGLLGDWLEAQGEESWSMSVTLAPGENIICARATDTSSNTKEAFVIVTYTPGQEPKLCTSLDPPSHDFGVVPKDQEKSWNFDITNCGGNTLTWSVSCDQPWIKVNPTSDGTTEESDKVTVTVDTHGLSEGKTYTGHITVTSNGGSKTGVITVNIEQTGPKLCTSPDPPSHDFGMVPKDQEKSWDFEITNCGSDTLEWVVSEVPHWITVGTTSGETTTETDVVTITIDTSGLPPGAYWEDLIVNSNGGRKRGAILVIIPDPNGPPILCTSPDPLTHDFGTVPIGQERSWEFEITNCGSDTLLWDVISFDPSWISTDVMQESTTTETDTVTVTINTSKLSYGKHGGRFRIFSNGGEKRGTITVDVSPPASEPKLCTSPDTPSHDFGTVPKDQEKSWNFEITNCGSDTLTWSVSSDQTWIKVNPASDSTAMGTDRVTITIDTHGLNEGKTYTGQITIDSNGGRKTGTITVNVPGQSHEPKLCTSPDPPSHDFGTVPKGQTRTWNFDVTNCGSDTVLWSIISLDPSWLSGDVIPESTTTEIDTATITIDTSELSYGKQEGHFLIVSNGGSKTGTITVEVVPPTESEPKLCTSPDPPTTNFGTVPKDQTRTWDFFITNSGSDTLTWAITCDQPSWLNVNPASGSTTTLDVVTVTIDTHDLTPGTHTGHITLTSNGGEKIGTITVNVPPPAQEPKLCTSPDPPSTNFGTVPKDQTRSWDFFITNCGSGTLTWAITCDQPSWLNVNPAIGSTTTLDVVTVTIDTHDLSPGTHTGQITVTSNGGEKTGTITVNVPSKPSTPNVGFKGIVLFPCTYGDFTGQGIEVTKILSDPNGKLANCKYVCTCWTEDTLAQIDTVACGDEVEVYGTLIEAQDVAEVWMIVRLETSTHYIVRLKQGPPQLRTWPTTLLHDFGTVAKDQTRTWNFDVTNCGSGTLTWSVSDDKNWISVYPTSGSTTTERDTVTVRIDTQGLSPGTHTGHITLTSNGGEKTGTITVVVPKPKPKPQNQPPENPTLTPDRLSPELAGTTIKWTASATDPDGDTLYYQFRLKGPATGNSWAIKRDWNTAKTWTWYTTASDVGDTDISVWIRDGHHASKSSYDLKKTVYDHKITADKKRPTATIDSITPNPATQGDDTVRFKGHGYDSDGYIVDYYWKSSKDGKLSSSKEFTKSASNLDVGTHTIYFKVKDDDAQWSDWATMTLKIKEAITRKPDLIVSSIKFNPNPASAGNDVVVSVTVKNQGKGDAGAHDEFLGYPDRYTILKEWYCSRLRAGASKTFTHTLTNVQKSDTYSACADIGGVVEESDDDNNWQTAYLEVKEQSKYVKSRGVVTGIGGIIGYGYWYVNVDEWISGSLSCDKIYVILESRCPWGSADPDISTGDRVEVYGDVNPRGDDECSVGLNGESYYIKKV